MKTLIQRITLDGQDAASRLTRLYQDSLKAGLRIDVLRNDHWLPCVIVSVDQESTISVRELRITDGSELQNAR
jgi:hypothetical protein